MIYGWFLAPLVINNMDWTLVIIALQLGLLVVQTILFFRQTKLTDRQLDLIGRTSRLRLAFDAETEAGASFTPQTERTGNPPISRFDLEVMIQNYGSKTSRDYYITVLFPSEWRNAGIANAAGLSPMGTKVVDARTYAVYQAIVTKPLYPNRWAKTDSLFFDAQPGSFECLWHIADEDGDHPSGSEYGRLSLIVH